jgi:phosphoadenylyl-sulfate reductase (thioredoxin)
VVPLRPTKRQHRNGRARRGGELCNPARCGGAAAAAAAAAAGAAATTAAAACCSSGSGRSSGWRRRRRGGRKGGRKRAERGIVCGRNARGKQGIGSGLLLRAASVCRRLRLNLQVVQAEMSPARMEALHGRLWETGKVEDLELYHRIRKVEPLDRALARLGVRCWASGVRGSQTDHRRGMQPLDSVRGRWSLRPLLSWSNREVFYYMQEHDLPQHPLFEQGYSTVGDWHSSAPDDGSGRGSRFGGLKQECGLHLPGLMGEGI